MKKFTAFLLVLVMVLSILPTAAFAASPVSDFEYENIGTRVIINRYKGHDPEVVIPDTIEGTPVVTIDRNAFRDNPRIFSVKMPKNLMEIEDDAFAGCYNLELVIFTGQDTVRYGNNNIFSDVDYAKLILAVPQSCFPPLGENRHWLGGTFDVIYMYSHKCQDGGYSQDNKCDICGKEMETVNLGSNPVNLGSNPATRAQFYPAIAKAAARTTAVATRVLITTTVVIRNILKLFL